MFNYENFIEYLKQLNSCEEVLIAVYNYFVNNVKYNYDRVQYNKISGANGFTHEKITEFRKKYKTIYSYDEANFEKKISEIDFQKEKENAIKILDEIFMDIEKRPLSEKVKQFLFKDWGKVEYVEPKSRIIKTNNPEGKPYKTLTFIGSIWFPPTEINDPIYNNGLIISGVCEHYSEWVSKICNDLNIPCYQVDGKGTANHSWNLIYIKEQNKWVHFDMTCVRFYLDNFTKDFGKPDRWIFASTEDIFNMQPKREIHTLKDYDGNTVFEGIITRENYNEFENLEMNELCNKLGRSK